MLCEVEKLGSYTLQRVRIIFFAPVNPRSRMTRAASPVLMERHGPKTVTAGEEKQEEERKQNGVYLGLNIDSDACY